MKDKEKRWAISAVYGYENGKYTVTLYEDRPEPGTGGVLRGAVLKMSHRHTFLINNSGGYAGDFSEPTFASEAVRDVITECRRLAEIQRERKKATPADEVFYL